MSYEKEENSEGQTLIVIFIVQENTVGAADQTTLEVTEIELNFLVNVGKISGQVHIDTSGRTDLEIKQAYFTYLLDNGVSFTFGQYGAALGFEREDPAGLYSYSRAYGANDQGDSFDLGDIDSSGSLVHGLKVAYAADIYSIAASCESGDGNVETTDLNIKLSATYTGVENLSIGGGYFFNNESGPRQKEPFSIHMLLTQLVRHYSLLNTSLPMMRMQQQLKMLSCFF